MATEKTPSSGHGSQKPFERKAPEAKRDDARNVFGERNAVLEQGAQNSREPRPALERAMAQAKPVEKKPEPVRINGPMLLSDVQAALSDRYPHNDIFHYPEAGKMRVFVPGGKIFLDVGDINKCKNTAELRAYIDALPIQ